MTHAGAAHQGVLQPNETVLYPLPLRAREALLVEVEQTQVDVEVELLSPGRKRLLTFDTPMNRAAPERICLVAEGSGIYTLRIRPFTGAGGYEVRLLRLRTATQQDQLCFAAARAFQSAQQGKVEARITAYERAAKLWETAGEPFLAGIAWWESASLWSDVGPTTRAVDRLERALGLAQGSSSSLEISVLNRLGMELSDLGNLSQARAHLEEAEEKARHTGDNRGRAITLTNLGWLDNFMGQPHRAIDRSSEALRLWRQIGDPLEIAQVLQNLATAYGVLDHHAHALDLLAEALALARKAENRKREANILLAEGWIHYLRGRPAEGLPALRRVLEIYRSREDRNGEAAALDRLGTLLWESGDYPQAELIYRQSLELSLATQSSFDAAGTITNLGCLYAQSGRLQEAQAQLGDAHRRYRSLDDPLAISHLEYCSAKAADAAGDLDAALEHIHRALQIVDQLRKSARIGGSYYRPIWLWQDYAELEVALRLQKYRKSRRPRDLESAFQAADLARARTLFEQVMETRVGVHTTASESLIQAVHTLRDELNRSARKRDLGEAAPGPARDRLDSEIRRLQLELDRARAAIRAADPRHDATSPRPVNVELAQQLLAPRTALLSYVLGEDRSYLLVLDASGLTAHELAPRRDLEDYARAFYQAVQESRLNQVQWRLIALQLSRSLLPRQAIPRDTNRLIVVPDGLLHYIPFAALVSPRDEKRLVVEDFQVTYAPSVSVLARLRERSRQRPGSRIAVFADPVFSEDDPRFPAGKGREASRPGPRREPAPLRLRFSGDEARSIAALAEPQGSFVKLGFEATKRAVLESDLRAYGILHFATHAWIDEQFPELSGLALSRFDPEGRSIDADLRLHEIHGLDLNAELTVLSGCQTALGERVRGNGLEGFAQGFLYAGSSRVLVSLWKVADKATARLMAEFYRSLLQSGASPGKALRQAQDWLRRQPGWDAPYYWAPFVLQGDDSSWISSGFQQTGSPGNQSP